jgi:hypothetical protein
MEVVLGCTYTTGHINQHAGIFGVLIERFRPMKKSPIIAHTNTECKCRKTSRCSTDCPSSVYGISGSKLSFRNRGARI